MDLELSDEQRWLVRVGRRRCSPATAEPERLWARLVEFGALSVGGGEGLGAVELCLVARALGAHLAAVPYLGSAAVRFAGVPLGRTKSAVALAVLEPGSELGGCPPRTRDRRRPASTAARSRSSTPARCSGSRVAVARRARCSALVDAAAPEVDDRAAAAFDPTAPMYAVELADAPLLGEPRGGEAVRRLAAIGALLAAAEAVGAAGPPARRRLPLRRRAPPVRPHDRQLPGAAPPAGRHVRAPGQLVVDGPLRGGGARRGRGGRGADRVDRQGLRVARGARGRARRAAGLRRHRRHRGAPGAPLPAPDRRARAAVRRRGAPRARARPRARRRRRPGAGG